MQNNSAHIQISIVIPTCNEEGNIFPMYERLVAAMNSIHVSEFEFIFVDDGSSGQSLFNFRDLRDLYCCVYE